ncbi:MAG TPA: GMC oxidoreductase [Fimbriiglobus sp.]|nr:GMC oxidoreductase [Fimbriiglobus sp.]
MRKVTYRKPASWDTDMDRPGDAPDKQRPSFQHLLYHSGWRGHEKAAPAPGIPPEARLSPDLFFVTLRTERYRPSHLITLRSVRDGWDQDVFGAYYTDDQGKSGQWIFGLDPARYPRRLALRFVLDRAKPMHQDDVTVDVARGTVAHFSDGEITFPDPVPRYVHPYDNLTTTKTKIQQDAVPGNFDESIVYDVIIIGSGMGGATLADGLTDTHGRRVLVLDAGSMPFHTHIDNLPGYEHNLATAWNHQVGHYVNRPGSCLMFGVQMNLGGRSVYWEGLIPRMHDWEMDYWPASVGAHLLGPDGYDRAERLLRKCRTLGTYQDRLVRKLRRQFRELNVTDLPRSMHQPNIRRRGFWRPRWSITEVTDTSTGVFSTADLLLDSLSYGGTIGRDCLTVNLNHLITRIETGGDEAQAVVCQDLIGGVERRYVGRFIVLAAGSLESPRIAMASGLADPNHKVGVGLTDHPAFFGTSCYRLPTSSPFSGALHHSKVLLWHKDGAAHPYNVELLVNPQYWLARHADDDVFKQVTDTGGVTWVAIKFLMDSPLDDLNRLHYLGPAQKLEVEVRPNDTGLYLQAEVTDLRNRILGYLGADFDPAEKLDYAAFGTVHHAGGSLRMSNDHSGVVDENLKFEGYRNLYCCDVSVFPHIPTANPSLTLVALAQRLSDHLGIRCG